ncbi:MAG: DivIVA domain-containing protein, partial [Candidatus Zixiibacteriota bacterium]
MELTPNDIRNYEFPTQLRGYDKEEVDNFTEQVAAALEQAKQENLKLSMELEAIKGQLTSLKQFEETIKSAAIDARRNADSTVAAAKAEAQKIIAQARSEAEQVLNARSEQIAQLENQMAKLEMTRKSYVKKLRSTIESHLEIIDEIISEEAVAQAEA